MKGSTDTLSGRAPFSRQSRSDRSHFAAPLTDLTEGQCHTRVLGAPRPGREHNHQVCWDQVSHI